MSATRWLVALGTAVAVASLAHGLVPAAAQSAAVTLSIVGTNDVHGGVTAEGGHGGLALFGGYVRNLRAARARDGGAVLLLDAGDMWQGTLESNLQEGAPVVAAFNALGYAAAAVGNHEFDFGPVGPAAVPASAADDPRGALKARAADARFPFLAANLVDLQTGHPVAWPNVKPSVLVEAAGITVGIVGVMTSNGLRQTIAPNTRGLRLDPLAPTIEAEARRLRSSGAAVVIVAAHAGGRCSSFGDPRDVSSCDASSEIFEVARRLPRGLVDAIVAGHTHAGVAHEIGGIPVTEAFSGGRSFSRIDLFVDRATGRVIRHRLFRPQDICSRAPRRSFRCDARGPTAQYEGDIVVPDRRIDAILAPALRAASEARAKPVGVILETPVRRGRDAAASALGQVFVDAMRHAMGGDLAINNTSGGLRADWPAGPLLYGTLYRSMPFDNRLVVLRLRASEVARVLERELRRRTLRVSLSGARVEARCEASRLRVRLATPSGRLADDARVRVVTSDFVALGGDGILAPIAPQEGFAVETDGPLVRDAVSEWLASRGGRLRAEELARRSAAVWALPGPLPVSCAG